MTTQPPTDPHTAPQAGPSSPPDRAATTAATTPVPPPVAATNFDAGWRPLPARAHKVFQIAALLVTLPTALIGSVSLYTVGADHGWRWPAIAATWLAATAIALWVARKRYRYTFWKLDEDGFAVRRGRMWQWETRVPASRVQHLDLKRGPIERAHGLASLVLHTAGTRLSAVGISGLDDADAEMLRDHFSSRTGHQDDDDHA